MLKKTYLKASFIYIYIYYMFVLQARLLLCLVGKSKCFAEQFARAQLSWVKFFPRSSDGVSMSKKKERENIFLYMIASRLTHFYLAWEDDGRWVSLSFLMGKALYVPRRPEGIVLTIWHALKRWFLPTGKNNLRKGSYTVFTRRWKWHNLDLFLFVVGICGNKLTLKTNSKSIQMSIYWIFVCWKSFFTFISFWMCNKIFSTHLHEHLCVTDADSLSVRVWVLDSARQSPSGPREKKQTKTPSWWLTHGRIESVHVPFDHLNGDLKNGAKTWWQHKEKYGNCTISLQTAGVYNMQNIHYNLSWTCVTWHDFVLKRMFVFLPDQSISLNYYIVKELKNTRYTAVYIIFTQHISNMQPTQPTSFRRRGFMEYLGRLAMRFFTSWCCPCTAGATDNKKGVLHSRRKFETDPHVNNFCSVAKILWV